MLTAPLIFDKERYIYLPDSYTYEANGYVHITTGEIVIRLGCFTRKLSEWENDFWNNPKEFQNDGSKKKYRPPEHLFENQNIFNYKI